MIVTGSMVPIQYRSPATGRSDLGLSTASSSRTLTGQEVPMFWVVVALLYFVWRRSPSILGLFVSRAHRTLRSRISEHCS